MQIQSIVRSVIGNFRILKYVYLDVKFYYFFFLIKTAGCQTHESIESIRKKLEKFDWFAVIDCITRIVVVLQSCSQDTSEKPLTGSNSIASVNMLSGTAFKIDGPGTSG